MEMDLPSNKARRMGTGIREERQEGGRAGEGSLKSRHRARKEKGRWVVRKEDERRGRDREKGERRNAGKV